MPPVTINYFAVIGAAVANMAIGSVWYSPLLFEKTWLKAMGREKWEVKGAGLAMTVMSLCSLLTAYIMAHFADYVHAGTIKEGAQLGFWLWLGFAATATLAVYVFEGRSKKLYAIFISYQLVAYVAMGIILAHWRT